MIKKTFILDRAGVRKLMQSKEMQDILVEIGDNAVNSLGEGHSSTLNIGKTRANVNVNADSFQAKARNNKHNTILKAVRR